MSENRTESFAIVQTFHLMIKFMYVSLTYLKLKLASASEILIMQDGPRRYIRRERSITVVTTAYFISEYISCVKRLNYKYINRLKRTGKLLTAQMLPGLYLCVSTKFQLDLNGIDRKRCSRIISSAIKPA